MTDIKQYKLTTYSCFAGIFVQAIVCNITPLLFVPFMKIYGFSYSQLGLLVTINFFAQLIVDILFSKAIDHFGFKKIVLPATSLAMGGLILFGISPYIFDNIYVGMVIATIIFSSAGGLLEIVLSPIVDAIPNDHKGTAMALMHSFYAWGQVATIIVTTIFLFIVGIEKWNILLFIWAVVPLLTFIMFIKSKFPSVVHEEKRLKASFLFKNKFFIVALLAIFFGGATEVNMNQWASSFMEKGLMLPKVSGDLLGMAGFAVLLGLARLLYGIFGKKFIMSRILILSSLGSLLCYLVVVFSQNISITVFALALCGFFAALLWPGTLVITAEKFPMSGSWLFAILAAAGDMGAGFGPWLTGIVTDISINTGFLSDIMIPGLTFEQSALRVGLFVSIIFPIGVLLSHMYLSKEKSR